MNKGNLNVQTIQLLNVLEQIRNKTCTNFVQVLFLQEIHVHLTLKY